MMITVARIIGEPCESTGLNAISKWLLLTGDNMDSSQPLDIFSRPLEYNSIHSFGTSFKQLVLKVYYMSGTMGNGPKTKNEAKTGDLLTSLFRRLGSTLW